MKISVIIPALNEESNIRGVLEALFAQTYKDKEIIVIDNGSSDDTANIARTFANVKLVREDNKGTLWACERGRKEAGGEILARIDADCRPDPNWLEAAAAHFSSNMNVVALSGPYDYYDGPKYFRYISLVTQKIIYTPITRFLQLFKFGGTMNGGNSFFRSAALEKIGGFDTKFTFYGDETDTAKRLAKNGRIVFDPKLVMKTSARRFKNQGMLKTVALYWYYFFKGILLGG
jgi:glycosyltransferase involved in cell wall biosynthesis